MIANYIILYKQYNYNKSNNLPLGHITHAILLQIIYIYMLKFSRDFIFADEYAAVEMWNRRRFLSYLMLQKSRSVFNINFVNLWNCQ